MSQQQNEMLSALFDGQTSEFETRRLLQTLDDDGLKRLARYQLLRDVLQQPAASRHWQLDVSHAVQEALAEEARPSSRRANWLKPLTGFATAATIAFVAVLGVQDYLQPAVPGSSFVANGNVSASQLPLRNDNNAGVSVVSGRAPLIGQPRVLEQSPAEHSPKPLGEQHAVDDLLLPISASGETQPPRQ
ncbi:MAG TPA: sigma-E factor negative regulatory protein [Pseudomonadales bacterium]